MFESVDELVEENDRRRALELEEEEPDTEPQEHTLGLRFVFNQLARPTHFSDRQCRTYRGYKLLVRHIHGFKAILDEEDLHELNAYFKDVSTAHHTLI